VTIPGQIEFHTSPGIIGENEKVLDGLLNDKTSKEIKPGPNAIFLPMIFPNLYGALASPYRKKFESLSLRAYYKYAERAQVSFEKSPNDYVAYFNAKGFYFEKRGENMCIGSIYSKYPVEVSI